MSNKIELPKGELKHLYFEKDLSLKDTGEHFDCSAKTVKKELERYGFETDDQNPTYDIDEEKLYDLYYRQEKSLAELADFFEVSVSAIVSRMDKNGWERRQGKPQEMEGENNPFYGKSHTEEAKQKISEANKGRSWKEIFDEETLEKQKKHIKNLKYWEDKNRDEFAEKYSRENHWHHGKEFDEKHRKKISKGVEKSYVDNPELRKLRSETLAENGGPAYNPEACRVIEEYGKKHGYEFQHAENGGEKRIKNYFVDGYDEEENVVMEYYELHHSNRREYDRKRKSEIIDELENCKFIEIFEEGFVKVNWN